MNLEKIKINQIYINDKNKEGKPLMTSNGKKYWKVAIKCNKYPDKYITCMLFNQDDEVFNWQPNDEVEVVIEQNGDFLNFKRPTQVDRLKMQIDDHEERIRILEIFMKKPEKEEEVEEDINPNDLPF